MVFVLFGLVVVSPHWLVLGLAITVVDPFSCPNAERLRMHIKIYHYPRQIKLPVVYAHRVQPHSNGLEHNICTVVVECFFFVFFLEEITLTK